MYHFSVSRDGDPSTERACLVCENMWSDFIHEHHGGYSVNSFLSSLEDCIANGAGKPRHLWYVKRALQSEYERDLADFRKEKVEHRKWRDYIAIILRRRRVHP